MNVICTAGHVDHGKSTLVRALTGQEPDRLEEERRRGLTIDLGFAWTTLDGVGDVAFVDLPGHERFVPNMLAGAGPSRLCLFVVAADEGWMPQSAEHLTILDLLGVDGGLVALTRSDLADDLTRAVAAEEVRDAIAGTVLADAPLIEVSSTTGDGLDRLRQELVALLSAAPHPADLNRPRLWVDRVFTVRGAGTVVTGTLSGGRVHVGDELIVHGQMIEGREVRVRGLHALGREIDAADPGWRVAINLVGVDTDEISRGDAVCGGTWLPTDEAEAWCTPATGASIGRRGAWTAHVGTAAVPVAVHPVEGVDLTRDGPVRLELARELPLVSGDRLVLREAGRSITAGGGVVLDPCPSPRVRGTARRQAHAADLAVARDVSTPDERLRSLTGLHPVLDLTVAGALANAPSGPAPEGVEVVGRWVMAQQQWDLWAGLAVTAVASGHQRHPARGFVAPEGPRTLLQQAGCPIPQEVLARLVALDRLERVPGGVRVPGHQPRLTVAQQQARERVLAVLDDAGASPPPLVEVATSAGADDDLLDALLADGQLHALPGLAAAVSQTTWRSAIAALSALQLESGAFTASQARDALGTTRKFVLPLLEALDAAGITRRDGDVRQIHERSVHD